MADRLTGKVALITGSGGGIGRGIATRFASEGASVGVLDILQNGVEETVRMIESAGGSALALVCDLRDPDQVREAVSKLAGQFGPVNVVVNNAANALALPHGEYTAEAWAKSLDVNLRGPVFLVQEALPHLKQSGHAAVLNVLSGAAFLFSATVSLYGIGKAGLMAATRSMAAEFAPHGIRVNALSPGTTDTDMVRKNPPEAQAEMTKLQLLPRIAHPDEMVGPALLLTSDAGSFITGQVIFADGGMVPR